MQIYELKTEMYDAILDQRKAFEIWPEDQGAAPALRDCLLIREYDSALGLYTGRCLLCQITFAQELSGFSILGIRLIAELEENMLADYVEQLLGAGT